MGRRLDILEFQSIKDEKDLFRWVCVDAESEQEGTASTCTRWRGEMPGNQLTDIHTTSGVHHGAHSQELGVPDLVPCVSKLTKVTR